MERRTLLLKPSYNESPHRNVQLGSVILTVTFAVILAILSVCIIDFAAIPSTNFGAYLVTFSIDNITTVFGLFAASYLLLALKQSQCERSAADADLSFTLKTIFVWIFGLGVILQECLYLAIDGLCLSNGHGDFFVAPIVYRIVNITFILLQLAFISFSKTRLLASTHKIDFCILCIVLSNLCFWLKGTVKDVANLYRTYGWAPIMNRTNDSFPTDGVYCFWYSPIQKVLPAVTNCTIPMQFEFQLLATIFFIGVKNKQTWRQYTDSLFGSRNESELAQSRSDPTRHRHAVRSFVVCIVFIFPMTVVDFLARRVYANNELGTQMLRYAYLLNSGVAVVSLILYVCGFHYFSTATHNRRTRTPVTFNQIVMIFTMTSVIAFYIVVFLSVIHTEGKDTVLTCVECFMMMADVFYQAIFIIMVNRSDSSTWLTKQNEKIFMFIFVFHGVFNLYMWFMNTFFDLRSTTQLYDGGDLIRPNTWLLVKRVIFPFGIYFRFHSSMEFYALFRRCVAVKT